MIYENSGPKIVKVISFDTAAGMTYMLRKVVEVGTGRAANISKAAAGKTGTTDDYHDAWFMGYTPDIVAGVWLGNDDNTKLPGITGGGLPARVWADYMKVATTNFADSVFDYPKLDGTQSSKPQEIKDTPEQNQSEDDMNFEDFEEGFPDEQNIQNSAPSSQPVYQQIPENQNTYPQNNNRPFDVEEPPMPQAPLPSSTNNAAPLPGAY